MSILNHIQGRQATVFLRLCICIFIAITLALSGIILNTQPVNAIGITADPGATINVTTCEPFSVQFSATGTVCTPPPDPFFWYWPALPGYANLDPNTGLLTGCPQVGDNTTSFFVGVSEFSFPPLCGPTSSPPIFVTINVSHIAPACDMVIEPTFYPVAWEGLPFSMSLNVTGGIGPFNWSVTGLPSGLSVTDPVAGIISGIPDPGTCGIYTATANVTDTGTCCCPDASRDFVLIVDCLANYPTIFYYTTGCDFNVEIGPGLSQGQTKLLIDGIQQDTLVGGQSEAFTSTPCESHLVMVDQMIQSPNSNTRFSVMGSNIKTITDTDNYAYFDYTQEVHIDTASSPGGIIKPKGNGFYAAGSYFSSTTPGIIEAGPQMDTRYIFREWQLPDNSKFSNKDLAFAVNQAGTATAEYDTFYQLTLTSDYPSINEISWERQGETATWDLSLHSIPMESGFWAFLGGTISPINSSGSQLITEPTIVEITWKSNYTVPIIAIVIVLIVIAGFVFLIYYLRARSIRPSAQIAEESPSIKTKKSTTRKQNSK